MEEGVGVYLLPLCSSTSAHTQGEQEALAIKVWALRLYNNGAKNILGVMENRTQRG
jgi:hypothetical protein